MVFYCPCTADPSYTIYVGEDKFENESLIAYGFPTDVWFHADNFSSAHVYLRMKEGDTWDKLPSKVVEEVCHLTKDNSLKGRKESKLVIIYTPWDNLLKTTGMDTGSVSFKDPRLVRRISVGEINKDFVKNYKKNRIEEHPNFKREKEMWESQIKKAAKQKAKEEKAAALAEINRVKAERQANSYDSLFDDIDDFQEKPDHDMADDEVDFM